MTFPIGSAPYGGLTPQEEASAEVSPAGILVSVPARELSFIVFARDFSIIIPTRGFFHGYIPEAPVAPAGGVGDFTVGDAGVGG